MLNSPQFPFAVTHLKVQTARKFHKKKMSVKVPGWPPFQRNVELKKKIKRMNIWLKLMFCYSQKKLILKDPTCENQPSSQQMEAKPSISNSDEESNNIVKEKQKLSGLVRKKDKQNSATAVEIPTFHEVPKAKQEGLKINVQILLKW